MLKCDIRLFFASIDHATLVSLLKHHLEDERTIYLLEEVIKSFSITGKSGTGLPLGNLTSQLFANIYLNQLDQFVKRKLKVKHYLRYADDFVLLHEDRNYLENLLPSIVTFLHNRLRLEIHPKKVSIKTIASGVDFLGWTHFPHYRVLRTVTKRRMLKKLKKTHTDSTWASYLGLLSHGNTYKLAETLPQMTKIDSISLYERARNLRVLGEK